MWSRDMMLANLVAAENDGPEDVVLKHMFASPALTRDREHHLECTAISRLTHSAIQASMCFNLI